MHGNKCIEDAAIFNILEEINGFCNTRVISFGENFSSQKIQFFFATCQYLTYMTVSCVPHNVPYMYRSTAYLPWSLWVVTQWRTTHQSSTCTTEHYTAGSRLAETSSEQAQNLIVCLKCVCIYFSSLMNHIIFQILYYVTFNDCCS